METIPTHVPNLDVILGGGLLQNITLLINGPPGSGKTIFTNQIAYGSATPEYKALLITTVSEPMSRMIRFIQGFSFFALEKAGSAVIYEDVGPVLLEGGGENTLAHIAELVLSYQPGLVVVDSFKAILDLSESPTSLRRALYQFAAQLAALSCTTLLVSESSTNEIIRTPEAAIVDGIIELSSRSFGPQSYRSLRIHKLRGSSYLAGEHTFEIGPDGVTVFPRFSTPATPQRYAVNQERVPTGIVGLDELLCGGLLRGTSALVAGDPGVGKTITALHFLFNGAALGEPGAYISFQENPDQLAELAHHFGFDVNKQHGQVAMFYTSPVDLDIDKHALEIIATIERVGARRVVIDGIGDFEEGARRDNGRYFNYVYSLVEWLKNRGITSLLTAEMSEMFGSMLTLTAYGVSHIADNLLVLRYVPVGSEIRRVLSVLKTRGSDHSKKVHEFFISPKTGPGIGELVYWPAVSHEKGEPLAER